MAGIVNLVILGLIAGCVVYGQLAGLLGIIALLMCNISLDLCATRKAVTAVAAFFLEPLKEDELPYQVTPQDVEDIIRRLDQADAAMRSLQHMPGLKRH
jgi:hypothetical protein